MDWLLKLLGVSPKGRKAIKSISQLAKDGRKHKKFSVTNSNSSKQKASKPSIVEIEDLDYDEYEIVGESFYQAALEKHAGPKTEQGANHRCVVMLICEPNNKFDKNAVKVELTGDTVGYLSSGDAVLFREMLKSEGLLRAKVRAHAIISGGWKTDKDEGHFGIELDFDWDNSDI